MKRRIYLVAAILCCFIIALAACDNVSGDFIPETPEDENPNPPQPPPPPPSCPTVDVYTIDTDGDTLPDGIEEGETESASWNTEGEFDIYRVSTGFRDDDETFNSAYDAYKRALTYLVNRSCAPGGVEKLDTNGNGVIDIEDDLMNPAGVMCEEGSPGYINIRGVYSGDEPTYLPDEIVVTILQTSPNSFPNFTSENNLVTIEARVTNASYLEYQRFTFGNTAYGANVVIDGDLYAGGNLSVNSGAVFKGDVYVGGTVSGSGAVFEGTVVVNFPWELVLDADAQIDAFYRMACYSGWVISASPIPGCPQSGGRHVLGDSSMGGSDNLLVLDNFKNLDNSMPNPPNQPRYDGPGGTHILPANFNGIIVWDDSNSYDLHTKGFLGFPENDGLGTPDSVTGRGKSVAVFARTRNIRIDAHIRTGTNHLLQPVNVAFVVSGEDRRLIFEERCPNWMINNAAIMVTKATGPSWMREGTQTQSYVHDTYDNWTDIIYKPCLGINPCVSDIDVDGIIENPNAYGWNEMSFNPRDTNLLVQQAPIITQSWGNAGPWHVDFPSNNGASTRIYRYDPDMLDYPPPVPRIPNLYRFIEMTVAQSSEGDQSSAITIDGPTEFPCDSPADYSASGGTPPYRWSVDNTDVATINEITGSLSIIAPGVVTITVTDSAGCTACMEVTVKQGPCGALTVTVPSRLSVCNPPGELANIYIYTFEVNENFDAVPTTLNDIGVTVSPPCTIYNDPDKTEPTLFPILGTNHGGTRRPVVPLYLESSTHRAGDLINVTTTWTPPSEGCPNLLLNKAITIIPGDPCDITMELGAIVAHVCDDGSGRCNNYKDVTFTLRDNCGNRIPFESMEFQIQYNDASGKYGWLGPPDDPGTLYPTDDGPIVVVGDENGEVIIRYWAPPMNLTAGEAWVTIEGSIPERGEGCVNSILFPVTLLPCTPDHMQAYMPAPLYGCMNRHIPIDVYVQDACCNNLILSNLIDYNPLTADLNPNGKDVITATLTVPQGVGPYQDETISMWEEIPPFGTLPYPPNSFTVALQARSEWGITEPFYRILYNTRTDEPDRVPRGPLQVEFTYHGEGWDSNTEEYFRYIPDPVVFTFDLNDCNCYIWAANYPEYFCNPAGGLTLACPYDASLWAIGGGHEPDNEGKIIVTSGTYQAELRVGDPENPDVYVSQTDEFPFIPFQETEFFTWPFWLRNKTFPINGGVALRLEETDANGDLMCFFDWSTTVLCSGASIELLDNSFVPAVTYDPYDPDEAIYIELEDCNRPGEAYIEVDIYSMAGDREVVRLYADDPIAITTYRNRDGLPVTALDLPVSYNGILEVNPGDKIWVDYADDTTGCACMDLAHDEVEILDGTCVPVALYSGTGGSFGGTALRVHWGDVLVNDDVDLGGPLDSKVPQKNRSMTPEDTVNEYSGPSWEDRWADIYVQGVVNGDASGLEQPFVGDGYPNVYQNLPVDVLECIMTNLDYDELKMFAIESDVYYYAIDDTYIAKRHKNGAEEDPVEFQTAVINDTAGFMFIDLIDAPGHSPQPTGATIDAGAFDAYLPTFVIDSANFFYEGTLYIAGNLDVSGVGDATSVQAKTPPLDDMPQPMFPPVGESTAYDLPDAPDPNSPEGLDLTLDVHINGLLYLEGYLNLTTNLKVFGSVATERGLTGSADPEIWYNYLNSRGCNQSQCCALAIHPSNPDIPMSSSYQFTASGGTGGQVIWSFKEDEYGDPMNQSGGTITVDGLYTAGDVLGAVDTIMAEDVGGCEPGYTDITVICPTITIEGPNEIEVGDNPDYEVTGGASPYTWSVDFPAIATIDENTGQLTTLNIGTVKITVTDANGCKPANDFLVAISAPVGCQLIYFNDWDGNEQGNFASSWKTCTEYEGGLGSDNCNGQDDWQTGAPNGNCGDPDSAYSGTNIIGNDIGGSGWDGCYANSVTNYILSPVIDSTGFENIKLQFRKWLNVRSNDRLELYVKCGSGGWDLMVSYQTVYDSAWDEVVFAFPPGDCENQSSIQFRFLLDTNSSDTAGGWNIDDFYLCGSPIP